MIRFEHITKRYKDTEVLHDVSFSIPKNETVCLIGESGSGKTTLLKMINRLIRPTSGTIYINDQDIRTQNILDLRRNIGYVIQQTGLFPHLSVAENIELIPRTIGRPADESRKRTYELLEMVGLAPAQYADRYPAELSGGQQQRVGVARAFACDPEIILMDEPFSALDPLTRTALQDEVGHLQDEFKKTIVFVTHDMDEAIRLGDRICILDKGNIVQYDTPENILRSPANSFVERFIGKNRIWRSPEYIRAADIMITEVHICEPSLSAFRALNRMQRMHINGLFVTDRRTGRLLGSVSAQTLRELPDLSVPVEKVMQTDIRTVTPEATLPDTLQLIQAENLYFVPVVAEDRRLLGLLTQSSLVTTLSQQYLPAEEVAQ
ncbi:MAG: ABC transporter ATP-binding protein [Veillonellaceae bacterium]|nr:ABC transporter ATP-binding protein [Veillonellaceae bacterium]